jgi:hypothetical protein
VRFHGVRGCRSPDQVNASSMTTDFEVLVRPADLVGEHGVAPLDRPRDRLRVRVDEELRGVEAVALVRVVRPMHAVAVVLAGAHVGQVAVPHLVGALRHADLVRLLRVVRVVEEAQLHPRRVLREEGEVDAFAVPRRAEGVLLSGPHSHLELSMR